MTNRPTHSHILVLSHGEIRAWIEQEQSIRLKAVTRHGDPVELSWDELTDLIEGLQRLKAELDRLDVSDENGPEGAA
jgi:hypothetical protein